MSESATLPWMVIRQDEDGGRYRVGRYATLLEAQALAERLTASGPGAGGGESERTDSRVRQGSASAASAATQDAAAVSREGGRLVGAQRVSNGEAVRDAPVEVARDRRYLVERLDYPGGNEG